MALAARKSKSLEGKVRILDTITLKQGLWILSPLPFRHAAPEDRPYFYPP